MSVTAAADGDLDGIQKADDGDNDDDLNAINNNVTTNTDNSVAAAAAAVNGGVPNRSPSPRSSSLSPSPKIPAVPSPLAAAAIAEEASPAATATTPAMTTSTSTTFAKVSAPPSASPRIFGRAKRSRLGWSGLPKQMSCSSASTIRFAGGDNVDIQLKKDEDAKGPESSASTNHLDRLRTAVTTPLLRSRQSSTSSSAKRFSNLFPCPLVKTLDLDSPEGSLSSLGIVSGLNPHYVGPFASSTGPNLRRRPSRSGGFVYGAAAAARMRAQREAYNRARSLQSQQPSVDVPIFVTDDDDNVMSAGPGSGPGDVQSCYRDTLNVETPVRLACSGPPSAGQESAAAGVGWGRQTSLPVYSFLEQRGTFGGLALHNLNTSQQFSTPSPHTPASVLSGVSSSVRSPRPPPLKQAKSLHAQTHKLRRQVTICEDSISIADSQLLISRQGSRSDSRASLLASQIGGLHHLHQRVPSALSSSASPNPLQPSFSPSPALTPQQQQQQQQQQPCLRPSSPVPSVAASHSGAPHRPIHHPPPTATRLAPMLPRQESSFTTEEINSLQEAFQQLDLDGDGKLSRKEVEAALGNILSESDLDHLVADLDVDQSGEVEWQEFLNVMKQRMREPESVKMLKEAFRVVAGDGSGDGYVITAEKMRHTLACAVSGKRHHHHRRHRKKNKDEEDASHDGLNGRVRRDSLELEVEEMLRELDLDGDGKVRMEDFVRLLVNNNEEDGEGKDRELGGGEREGGSMCDKCVIL